jgi:hypothetical protein
MLVPILIQATGFKLYTPHTGNTVPFNFSTMYVTADCTMDVTDYFDNVENSVPFKAGYHPIMFKKIRSISAGFVYLCHNSKNPSFEGTIRPDLVNNQREEDVVAESIVFVDNFVGTNGSSISSRSTDTNDTWSIVKDAVTINANRAVQTSVVAGGAIAISDKGYANVVLKGSVMSTPAGNDEVGLIVRYVDNNNFYKVFIINTGNPFRISQMVAGVETLLVFGGSANDLGTINTDLEVIVNGTELLAITNGMHLFTSIPLNTSATKHGIYVKKAQGTVGGNIKQFKHYQYSAAIPANKWTVLEPASVVTTITVSTPRPFQILQRTNSSADITISGKFVADGFAHDIEASFNGGTFQTIAAGRRQTFFGTLTNQPQGQGNLIVRLKDNTSKNITIPYVGIGDVYLSCGQSNAADWGQIANPLQQASHPTLVAGRFSQSYVWTQLVDPMSDQDGWIDTVSKTTPAPSGSYGQILATLFMADQGVPIAIIPASAGGSAISQWQKGSDPYDRTTLFGSAMYKASLQPNGIKLILMHQGESDATIASGPTAPATYQTLLNKFVNDAVTTLGPNLKTRKVVLSKIHKWDDAPSTTQANVDGVHASIDIVIAANPNAVLGANFDKPTRVGGSLHFGFSPEANDAARRLWARLKFMFY